VAVKSETDNKYIKNAEIQISVNGLDFRFNANSQLDTACPISLVKANFIPPDSISRSHDAQYEGINDSALKIQGAIRAKVRLEDVTMNSVIIRVMPDHTVKCVILIRDILKKLGFTIAKRSDEKDKNSADEILNIEVSEATAIDTLDVNPNLPYTR